MEYLEYMDTLKEQIENKHAKELVAEEIEGHLMEQAESYAAEGMEWEEAMREAVRQMGDPVETGGRLNRIHRPIFPFKLLLMSLGLTVIAMLIQAVLIGEMGKKSAGMYGEIFLVHGVEFALIFAMLYMDYTAFVRHVKGLYIGYLLLLFFFAGSEMFALDYSDSYLFSYSIQSLCPLFFSGILYQNRGRGVRGMLAGILWVAVPMFALLFVEKRSLCVAVRAENLLICLLLLLFAIGKGIFGKQKKRQYAFLSAAAAVCAGCVIFPIFRNPYWAARLSAILHPWQGDYQSLALRENLVNFQLFGRTPFLPVVLREGDYESYLLNDVFSYFGVAAGVAVLALFAAFLVYAFRQSYHQRNRMGFLIGMAAASALLVRVAAYLAINSGCAFWYTTAVPFFSGNLADAVVNGIYVGFLFSVMRNKMIVREAPASSGKKEIRLTAS